MVRLADASYNAAPYQESSTASDGHVGEVERRPVPAERVQVKEVSHCTMDAAIHCVAHCTAKDQAIPQRLTAMHRSPEQH